MCKSNENKKAPPLLLSYFFGKVLCFLKDTPLSSWDLFMILLDERNNYFKNY